MVWGSNPDTVKRFLSSPKLRDWFLDPPSPLFSEYGDSFPLLKWAGSGGDHSTPSNPKVNKRRDASSHPVYILLRTGAVPN